MSELHKLLDEAWHGPKDRPMREPSAPSEAHISSLLRVVSSTGGSDAAPTRQSPSQDWDALILRVQAAAKQTREVEAQAREREARIEQVLERVRQDIHASNERARAAELLAREVQVRAEARTMAAEARAQAAEARAQAAEERAQAAEGWLARVQEAIVSEFADLAGQAA